MSTNAEKGREGPPEWLMLGLLVMAGSAGYTLLAYLVWLWAS